MILVDPRIGSAHLIEPLRKRLNCKVKGQRLNGGDLCFMGNGPDGEMAIGIELKEIRDFLGSMRSGRLAGDQIVKMSQDYQMSFVIIQGLWRPGRTGLLEVWRGGKFQTLDLAAKGSGLHKCFHYAEPFKHLVSLSVVKNIIVLRSSNVEETIWQIIHLYEWFQKPWDHHRSTDPIKLQTEVVFHRISLLRKIASVLPGIGWTRSAAVEKAFISVFHMVNAPVESWEAIQGIGPKLARSVWTAIREHV